MAFNIPFIKPKESAAPPSTNPPPPATPSPAAPPADANPGATILTPRAAIVSPRPGSLAAALKAATATPVVGASQSAIFKPKVSVVLKAPAEAAAAPVTPTIPEMPPDAPAILEIPSFDIISLLPEGMLLPDAAANPEFPAMISLDTAEILPQLATGRIQVPLSKLVASIPQELTNPEVFASGDTNIRIPLSLVIPRLPESVMAMPAGQVKQQIDASIQVPFAEHEKKSGPEEGPTTESPSAEIIAEPASTPMSEASAEEIPSASPVDPPPPEVAPSPMPAPVVAKASQAPAIKPLAIALPKPIIAPPSPLSRSTLSPGEATKAMTQGISLPTRPSSSGVVIKPPIPVAPGTLPKPMVSIPKIATSVPSESPASPSIPAPAIATTKQPPVGAPVPVTPPPTATAPKLASPASVPPSLVPIQPPLGSPPPAQPASVAASGSHPTLQQLLGLPEGTEIRIAEVPAQIQTKFGVDSVLVATEDGLPMVGAMPKGMDSNAWSGLGPQLFRSFTQRQEATALGSPRRCMLNLGKFWLTLWNAHGICMIFTHKGSVISQEFDQAAAHLVREIASRCHTPAT